MIRTTKYYEDKLERRRDAVIGFSFTCLFFGCLVPLHRGHWFAFFISALITAMGVHLYWTATTWAICIPVAIHIAMAFKYNSWYEDYLLSEGYKCVGGMQVMNTESYLMEK